MVDLFFSLLSLFSYYELRDSPILTYQKSQYETVERVQHHNADVAVDFYHRYKVLVSLVYFKLQQKSI